MARGGILREGLGYDRNDVAVVLNISADHLGLRGVNTLQDLADVKSVVVEAVPPGGHAVLNADDPNVAALWRRCSGEIVWFTFDTAQSRSMLGEGPEWRVTRQRSPTKMATWPMKRR